jgi:hypothetical protein
VVLKTGVWINRYPFVASEILGAQIKGFEEIFFDVNSE